MESERLCELEYEKAIEIIKDAKEVYVPWFIQGDFRIKLRFAGDYYDAVPAAQAVDSIKKSSYGANVWLVDGKFIVKCVSSMW